MKKFTKRISLLLLMVLVFAATVLPVSAESKGSLYSVQAILPENQINSKVTYYDLRMEAGQEQTIELLVKNISDEDVVITVSVNNAATNTNGNIMYTVAGIKDESMNHDIESIATIRDSEFTLSVGEEKIVEIDLDMPEVTFDGVILGGILVQGDVVDQNDSTDEQENGLLLENKVAYVIGLKLSETDNLVKPNMNYLGTEPVLYGLATSMGVKLQNTEAIIMKNVTVQAEIYKKNSDTLLHESTSTTVEIAPNSTFNYIVDWEGQAIEAGSYRLKLKVVYEDKVWEWDEEFEVGKEETNEINDGAIEAKKTTPILLYVVLGGSIGLLLLIVAFLLGRRSKEKK